MRRAAAARKMHPSQRNATTQLTSQEISMPTYSFGQRDLPQPTQPLEELNLASDMFQTIGLAAVAGISTALASGAIVVMLALHVA